MAAVHKLRMKLSALKVVQLLYVFSVSGTIAD